jgi:flagellar P-ring protein precursor FlgI
MSARPGVLAIALLLALGLAPPASAASRVGDLTLHAGDVPRRLVGYGLVVGLDGTGDRSFGRATAGSPTVRSVVNLLRRFQIEVPAEQLRMRDVAAVLVTAEASPYLRAGGRFEVQVSAIGDATSLRGGVLWMTPLVTDPGQPPLATAQGTVLVSDGGESRTLRGRGGNSGRIPQGGVLEVESPAEAMSTRLLLRRPDLATASRIAEAVNAAFGPNSAKVEDPGALALTPPAGRAEDLGAFLAAVDSIPVTTREVARVVIDGRDGTVVAGGGVKVGAAVVSHGGYTLEVGGRASAGGATEGVVRLEPQASVQEVAAGLHAAGARPQEIAAIFEALEAAGALAAQVLVR